MFRQHTLYSFNLFKFIKVHLWSTILSILESISPCAFKMSMKWNLGVLGYRVLWMSVRSCWFIVLVKSISMLIFCLLVLPIIKNEALKSPTTITVLSIFLFISVLYFNIFWGLYIFMIFLMDWHFIIIK